MTDKTKLTINNEKKKYRPNVAAIVLSAKYPHNVKYLLPQELMLKMLGNFHKVALMKVKLQKRLCIES